ncbi:MAG TPA: hypothetical protein VG457_18775 [Planctomycetota bacterium]|jgi:hypothetical protein|nr:hypothetical protein [Planctomycetota bacterium]
MQKPLAPEESIKQVRFMTVVPKKKETIACIELVKGSDRSAPIVLAATVEGFE